MTVSSCVRTQRAPTLVAAVKDSLSTVTTEHALVFQYVEDLAQLIISPYDYSYPAL